MTKALKNILSEIENLPISEQNAIAGLLKHELAWQKSFEKSQTQLSFLASEALAEYKTGKTKPMKVE